MTLHRQSALAFAPAFAASPRLQWLHWGWESALMLPRSSMSREVTREVGQGRLGCWTMGPKREELRPAGCWRGAGEWPRCPHAPHHSFEARRGHRNMGGGGLGTVIGLPRGSEGLGGQSHWAVPMTGLPSTQPSSPQHSCLPAGACSAGARSPCAAR